MTERKPMGTNWESWAERLILEAQERGEFDNLPGTGKPLPNRNETADDLWWVKQKLHRENLSFLPPTLILRKEAEDARAAMLRAKTEREVREIANSINKKINKAIREGLEGPPLNLRPFDVERIVGEWRQQGSG